MPRTLSLKRRMLILVTAVTVLMMSVIVAFDSYSLQQSVEETYVSQLNGMTIAINGRYEESRSIEDVQQIFDYIQYKSPNVLQLTLYGKASVQASTDRSRISEPTPPGLIQEMTASETQVMHLAKDREGRQTGKLVAPLKEDGATIGAIELVLDTSSHAALIKQRIQFIVMVALISTCVLLTALSLIIRKLLLGPLLRIREAALSVRQGSMYKEVEIAASQEIQEVADAFNDMVHDLEGRYSELQQAMQTIQLAQKQLVESEKMVALGNLVAGVSHEINTPIGIGVTAASYLDEKSKEFLAVYEAGKMKRSELEEYLNTVKDTTGMIQTNLMRASELVKSFKQVAVDRSVETKRSFAVKEYIQDVLVSLQPNLKKTKLRVLVEGPDNVQLFSNPGAVSQIITNLIMNSIIHAYSPQEEGQITLSLSRSNNHSELVLLYRDNGKGMSPEVAEQIFNPFFTTNRSGGGTGLGMHIVYNLVTQSLGGTIQCESTLEVGTTFRITIPMRG
ncbi:sensor histidine kinase [Paenibacillus koleovorans]|uniref:sensor histidine kinase n=1 Tax=Paenibacillus koleovorans TaxID=121608 RepID=UPI0013E3F566|nr:HAMP domain-containing sensor histidine kinase [Paenibacillus koleovorans]